MYGGVTMKAALRILVVEDYEPFRRVICSSLRERDFRVMETSDGLEAVEKAQELQPDLVLFDIGLPRLNGIESAKQVRSLVPNAKIMFVTQESSPEVIQETFRLGAQGYVHKQHAVTDLFPAIDAVLGGERFVSSTLGFSDGTDVEYHVDQKMEEDRMRYAAILESLDDAVLSVDMDGTISSWNLAACRMFGYKKSEAIGQQIAIIVPPELRHEENEILRRLRAGQRIDHYEAQRVTKDGKTIDVLITASLVRDAAGRMIGASGVIRDISERKRAEASLRESEERFRLVANTAPVMIWMSDVNAHCSYLNQRWMEFTGRSIDTDLGNGWIEGIHPEDLSACLRTYMDAFERHEPYQMEYRLRRQDGEYRWVFVNGMPRFSADRSFVGYIGSAIDVTERKLAETALSMMSQRLLQAQEEERRWIARELHDDISQRLASLILTLSGLKGQAIKPDIQKGIAKAIQDSSDIGKELRALSQRLHSSNLEYLGLAAAASAYCRERSTQHTVEVNFNSEGIPIDLPQEIAVCFFRVLQEAVQNAIKHSASRNLQVTLKGKADEIELTVSDFGVGFDPDDASKVRGLGLTSMKERLKLVNGTFVLDSQLGRGTKIHARVPWCGESSNRKRMAFQAETI
jgi:PAS domain S-box-containing protein